MIIGYIYKITINDESSSLNNHYYIGKHCSSGQGNIEEEALLDGYFGSGSIIKKYILKKGTSRLSKCILKFINCDESVEECEEHFLNLEFNPQGVKLSSLCLNLKNKSSGFGHGESNIMKNDEIRLRNKNAQLISQNKPDVLERQRALQKIRWEDKDLRGAQSERLKVSWKDPAFVEKIKKSREKYYSNPDYLEKVRAIQKKTQNAPENRNRQSGDKMYCLEHLDLGLKYAYEWREMLFPIEKSRTQSDMHECCRINKDRILKKINKQLRKTKGYTFSYISH